MTIPALPTFMQDGLPVYFIPGDDTAPRPVKDDVRLLVIHHSAGSDSRAYLRDNPNVGCHYLVGAYPDTLWIPRIYKYASEANAVTYTQGYGSIGGYDGNPNDIAASIEVEGGPDFRDGVIDLAARLARTILNRRRNALMLRHLDIDDRKIDPSFDWLAWCYKVYS
jgi:hypothetical protein